METINDRADAITCVNCITGQAVALRIENERLEIITGVDSAGDDVPFMGPGLIDLQVNGINGIDFNNPALTEENVIQATYYLLRNGITTFFPTIITNSDENVTTIMQTVYRACLANPIVNDCIGGIHLEGPFISPVAGAKGAHDEQYIKPPDWELFNRFQEAAGGKIKIITLAPEWEGSCSFIEKCREQKVIVSIGHSMASSEQISLAVKAGATMATHLGNAVPLLLPRHPNIIWDLLAAEELYTCIITDGIHVPASLIKVVIKAKAGMTLVVSDATCFAGMPPGEYQSHIGGTVILDHEKRVSLKNAPGLLAGAARSLLENVETLVNKEIATLSEAWQMASDRVAKMLVQNDATFNSKNDFVQFRLAGRVIAVERVVKNGQVVFEQQSISN